MAKELRELIFLKSTGALIGEVTSDTPRNEEAFQSKFNIKSIDIDEDAGEFWYGDYQSGEIRNRFDKPIISESLVKYGTNQKIIDKYPVHKQINILIAVIRANPSLNLTPEFQEMINFLDAQRNKHSQKLTNYSNTDAYHWVSTAEEQAEIEKKRGVNQIV